ncbi:TPA: hypothetical protein N0F65_010946, partial [Lagenidium giganteum]
TVHNDTSDASSGGAVKHGDQAACARVRSNATDTGSHCVWVGRVPSSICTSEEIVREMFGQFGDITAIRLHHDFTDMSMDGFMFIEFDNRSSADKAIDAIESRTIAEDYEMTARLALRRGPLLHEPDTDITDLLFGRRQARGANPFSQHFDAEDEDEQMLQSLSQHSFGSQRKKKRRKRPLQPLSLDEGEE